MSSLSYICPSRIPVILSKTQSNASEFYLADRVFGVKCRFCGMTNLLKCKNYNGLCDNSLLGLTWQPELLTSQFSFSKLIQCWLKENDMSVPDLLHFPSFCSSFFTYIGRWTVLMARARVLDPGINNLTFRKFRKIRKYILNRWRELGIFKGQFRPDRGSATFPLSTTEPTCGEEAPKLDASLQVSEIG